MTKQKGIWDLASPVPVASSQSPSRKQVYRAALAYIESGLSFIPIRSNGLKEPAIQLMPKRWCELSERVWRWGWYKLHAPTRAEVREWFIDSCGNYGMAILGGKISGNLEIIDLDNWDIVTPWMKRVRRQTPNLLHKVVLVQTPRPGLHVYYRCAEAGRSQKLAQVPVTDPDTGKIKPKTLIEIKGEGGYCLAPPSPAACHPTGRCYTVVSRHDLTAIPTIAPLERNVLIESARALNCWHPPQRRGYIRRPSATDRFGGRPGDDFNRRADWGDILRPHGWTFAGRGGDGSDHWCRPGKARGTSASTNFCGSELMVVFSSNAAPFEEGTAYCKFAAYALLNHDGDFHAAAKALVAQGYGGSPAHTERQRLQPFARYAEYQRRSQR